MTTQLWDPPTGNGDLEKAFPNLSLPGESTARRDVGEKSTRVQFMPEQRPELRRGAPLERSALQGSRYTHKGASCVGSEDSEAPKTTDTTHIEFLYRYHILWVRSKLLRHYRANMDLLDDKASKRIGKDLSEYSNALRDYFFLRTQGASLFSTSNEMDDLAAEIAAIEEARARLKLVRAGSQEAKDLVDYINGRTESAGREFIKVLEETTSGIRKATEVKESQALWARLLMAFSGGLALIAPMLIMVFYPTRLAVLLTTSCFVLGISVVLAVFMRDSQPKDIIACTAAYAAVLVVFVGVGGGSG